MNPEQESNKQIANDQLRSVADQSYYKSLNQDLKSNIQMGPAIEGTGQKWNWVISMFLHGLAKRKGIGKIVYILVVAAIFIAGSYALKLLLST